MLLFLPSRKRLNLITSMYSAPVNQPSKRFHSTNLPGVYFKQFIKFEGYLKLWLNQLKKKCRIYERNQKRFTR